MGVVKVWRCVELLRCNGTVTCWCQCEGICDGTLDCELVFTILFFFFIKLFLLFSFLFRQLRLTEVELEWWKETEKKG